MKLFFRITFIIYLMLAILIGCESDELLNHGTAFYNERGIAYAKKGQYDKAVSEFNNAIELNPKDAVSYTLRGGVHSERAQYDKAISDFTKAIELNPKLAISYTLRARLYVKQTQYDKAYNKRGGCYFMLDQYKRVCPDWKRACELGLCETYEKFKSVGMCK